MAASPARWRLRYALTAALTDIAAVSAAVLSYGLFGSSPHGRVLGVGVVVVLLTAVSLAVSRAWDADTAGGGSREFTRLLRGFLGSAVAIGLIILAAGLDHGRPWVFAVLPTGAALAVFGRLWLRHELHRRRRAGQAMARVLAVGDLDGVAGLIRRTRRVPEHGWIVDGVCTPAGTGPDGASYVDGVHVVGDLDAVPALARSGQFDVVSVGQAPGWTTTRLQRLAWEMEGTGVELAVDPGLMEVAGPRLHVASVDGLPLLRLSHPTFRGLSRLLKGGIDRVGALVALVLLSLPMLVIAGLVKLDGGPVFFLQRRVGVGGREFRMVKFRSMVVDAEARLEALRKADEGNGVLFKLRRDPRVTRTGAVLRRYSLDELPQLFNVLTGSMSLVGPRPPLPREVAGYANDARRRLLVKPGMTGLWQVSGRSDLSWEETVRLDLRYVENWTMALDAQILARTVHAMVRGDGAY
ncbi:sugar transferase [Pseudonocardia lacus]|uniref:sugar transferase n=1 Tax=Pseudonocardia lacus TaxID=2835865 RepID=UPI001BDC2E7F|nr:sugar transferase [Pseudonocardia lacus]